MWSKEAEGMKLNWDIDTKGLNSQQVYIIMKSTF